MIKNYIKITFRTLLKYKGYSLINISGLAIGMAACILILLWVQDELSYDRFHENVDCLYRVVHEWTMDDQLQKSALTPVPLAPELKENFPEILRAARFDGDNTQVIRYGDKRFDNDILVLADPDFLEMFSFPLILGDSRTAFSDVFSVVISQDMCEKYFGNADPIGEVLNIDKRDFAVRGVFQRIPQNSHIKFDCIVPFDSRPDWLKRVTERWDVSAYYTYIQLSKTADLEDIKKKIVGILDQHTSSEKERTKLSLQPVTRIHLYHDIVDYLEGHGDIKLVYLFSALAVVILVVACINFVNLTTARSESRTKEIGVRKIVGARRSNLMKQFFGESVISVCFALVGSAALVTLLLPHFNIWSGKNLTLNFTQNIQIALGLVGIVFLTGILAGSYPAIVLSSLRPIGLFKTGEKKGYSGSRFRRTLVVGQFAVSVLLVFGATVISNQLNFIREKPLGFNKEHLMYVQMRGDFRKNFESIKQELLSYPFISNVTAGKPPIQTFNPAFEVKIDDSEMSKELRLSSLPVDYDYVKTFGMEIIEGRDFIREMPNSALNGFIINETAAKLISPDASSLGKTLTFNTHTNTLEVKTFSGQIVGVVKDFHNSSLHSEIHPVIIYLNPDELYHMALRVTSHDLAMITSTLKSKWELYAADYPFECHFVDQTIENFYRTETNLGEIVRVFTVLAIFISCMGLFGMSFFTTEQRTKEIGIRKVLGASISNIVTLLSRQFLLLVLLADIVALPVAYYIMSKWLQNFAYRIDIGTTTFILSTILALVIALLTVTYQSVRAAVANPVDSLRYE